MTPQLTASFLRLLSGARATWLGCGPELRQRVYFANHTSNLDGPVLWATLPLAVRQLTRPVAARDYWTANKLRRFFAEQVFNAVLIERKAPTVRDNPIEDMLAAIGDSHSLILFPEGGRFSGPDPQPFKSGLFHLAKKRPEIELVPVLLDNMNRVLPKGELLPVPIISSVTFGSPIRLEPNERRDEFLVRAREAVIGIRQQ
ncbi:MAG: lysophospholipid acyltransferase family protein [Planctomycetia bacterium]|nr:lysophospholipid acyltransferase family protein [Planctomycetia bacterium]